MASTQDKHALEKELRLVEFQHAEKHDDFIEALEDRKPTKELLRELRDLGRRKRKLEFDLEEIRCTEKKNMVYFIK